MAAKERTAEIYAKTIHTFAELVRPDNTGFILIAIVNLDEGEGSLWNASSNVSTKDEVAYLEDALAEKKRQLAAETAAPAEPTGTP